MELIRTFEFIGFKYKLKQDKFSTFFLFAVNNTLWHISMLYVRTIASLSINWEDWKLVIDVWLWLFLLN